MNVIAGGLCLCLSLINCIIKVLSLYDAISPSCSDLFLTFQSSVSLCRIYHLERNILSACIRHVLMRYSQVKLRHAKLADNFHHLGIEFTQQTIYTLSTKITSSQQENVLQILISGPVFCFCSSRPSTSDPYSPHSAKLKPPWSKTVPEFQNLEMFTELSNRSIDCPPAKGVLTRGVFFPIRVINVFFSTFTWIYTDTR